MNVSRQFLAAVLLLLIHALPTFAGSDSPWDCREGRLKLCDGRRLAYREYGDPQGQLVFYFHGTPGSRLEAALVAAEACQYGVRLVSVDRPGLGCSTFDPCRRILDWPCDVAQLADSLGAAEDRFGIIGLSGGAPYACACALRMPERLSHVAIVSGHAPLGAPGTCPGNQDKLIKLIAKRERLGKVALGLINRRLGKRPDKVIGAVTKNWTAADRKLILCNPVHYRQLVSNLSEAGRCGAKGMVRDIRLLGSCWGFRPCQVQGVPVSIWQGGCDRIATPSMGRYFNRQIVGSELILDPAAGHVTMLKWHIGEIFSRFVQPTAEPTAL